MLAVVFGILWYKGHLRRMANYVHETKVELKKCNWPTWPELKESTMVVTISIIALTVFTVCADSVLKGVLWVINKGAGIS